MLIRNADINFGRRADIRIAAGTVAEIGDLGPPTPGETVTDAAGNALLPGLHDHHFHLLAFAASLESIRCGPPFVNSEAELVERLASEEQSGRDGWVRGIGYHESIAGEIDRDWLDHIVPSRPVRIQHRSGRLWILNSRALELLSVGRSDGPADTRLTGRLYDGDTWLRQQIGSTFPSLARAGAFLVGRGVTGLTDTSPGNGAEELGFMSAMHQRGDLPQDILAMGNGSLDSFAQMPGVTPGPRKIHLREAALPSFTEVCADIAQSHAARRPVAVHCVTLAELVFALGAITEAGAFPGDRIEHAGVAPPDTLPLIAKLGLRVVTQPNFIAERGDAYLRDVDPADVPWLYRLRGFRDAGIRLAAGTDAPFGDADPWKAMAAAVSRRSAAGVLMGADEAVTPEEALGLFTTVALNPGGPVRSIRVGLPADLCLLDRPWSAARSDLANVGVAMTIKEGRPV